MIDLPGSASPIDVLLLQLGTPNAPTAAGLRPYLREFLSDPRVIEGSAFFRWLLVNFVIVPFRSPKSAVKYQRIWDEKTGSPLLDITRRQAAALATLMGPEYRVRFAMRYGAPSIPSVVREIMAAGCRRLVVIPMFPQYSATTTASGIDALFDAMKCERVLPSMRIVARYHADPDYIDAVAQTVERATQKAKDAGTPPEMNLISFHGIPLEYIQRGDPYRAESTTTADLLAKRLSFANDDWMLTFQSRLGRAEWLSPYTDETLVALGKRGVKTVLVVQPGFTADCLETIDEIGHEGLKEFRSGGGQTLIRVPCVNDDPAFIAVLKKLVLQESAGWR